LCESHLWLSLGRISLSTGLNYTPCKNHYVFEVSDAYLTCWWMSIWIFQGWSKCPSNTAYKLGNCIITSKVKGFIHNNHGYMRINIFFWHNDAHFLSRCKQYLFFSSLFLYFWMYNTAMEHQELEGTLKNRLRYYWP